MDEEPTTTPAPEPNPYLWNRRGHTPFDEMDSLDHLEWKLQEEIRQEGESLPVTGDHQPFHGSLLFCAQSERT